MSPCLGDLHSCISPAFCVDLGASLGLAEWVRVEVPARRVPLPKAEQMGEAGEVGREALGRVLSIGQLRLLH